MTDKFRCDDCGSTNVEVLLPAWFDPNNGLAFVSADETAEELAIYCNSCGESTGLIAPNGKAIRGRW